MFSFILENKKNLLIVFLNEYKSVNVALTEIYKDFQNAIKNF